MEVTVLNHALARHYLVALRNRHSTLHQFRAASNRLSTLLICEATRNLLTVPTVVDTPLEQARGEELSVNVAAVPILRAGFAMLRAAEELLPDIAVGYIGLQRNEVTAVAATYYARLPDITGSYVLLLDPMLATGGSACDAVALIKAQGAAQITLVCVVAAPQGIERLQREHPDVHLVTAAIDRDLNALSYILPGLGDYGDRLSGT